MQFDLGFAYKKEHIIRTLGRFAFRFYGYGFIYRALGLIND